MNQIKRVLITGITGMVGSHLCDYIIENTDWQIFGIVRWRSSLENVSHLIPLVNEKKRMRLIEGDLLDQQSLYSAICEAKPDVIFHLAAQSYPTTSFRLPVNTLDVNVLGTTRLLEAIRLSGLDPLIHVCSSSEVYGRTEARYIPIKEDTPFHPASPYSISKIATDFLGKFYFEAYGLRVLVTRMFTHTGPRRGDVFAESSFAKQIAMLETGSGNAIVKVGNLDSLRTWADVRDAVRAYFMLVTENPIPGSVYNIGGSYSASIRDMLQYLISISTVSSTVKVEVDPARVRPVDADLQVPDCSKFAKHTGWKPVYSFEQTMLDLLQYWRGKVKNSIPIVDR